MKKFIAWKLNNGVKIDVLTSVATSKAKFMKQIEELNFLHKDLYYYKGIDSITSLPPVAYVITTEGEVLEYRPKNNKTFTLGELQGLVGGFIEEITITRGKEITFCFVNEEGKLLDLPHNELASLIVNTELKFDNEGHKTNNKYDLVGDVVFVKKGLVE